MSEMNAYSPFERNLGRLLKSSVVAPAPDFEERIVRVVLGEVRREPSVYTRLRRRTRIAYWSSAVAATVVALLAAITWRLLPTAQPVYAGKIKVVYGLVALQKEDSSVDLGQAVPGAEGKWEEFPSGAWISTRWGSQAEVLLADHSRLLCRPHTVVRVESGRNGETITLSQGGINIEAAKQAPHGIFQIETPGARIAILGTRLDVHVIQKADGRNQTRVSVVAGQVEMESGGKTILLPANTEGVADEGSPPVRRSLTTEVNELLRLRQWNQRLATEAGLETGSPAIIEFQGDATANVWSVVSLRYPSEEDHYTHAIQLKEEASEVEAFTLEGSPLKVIQAGRVVEIQTPNSSGEKAANRQFILRLGGVKGMFTALGKGVFEFAYTQQNPVALSLVQFRLPESAEIEEIRPEPVEKTKSISRQFLTVAAHVRELEIVTRDH
jgi:hypothetical protein